LSFIVLRSPFIEGRLHRVEDGLNDAWDGSVDYSAGYVADPLSHSLNYANDPFRVEDGYFWQQLDFRPQVDVAWGNPDFDAKDLRIEEQAAT